MPIKDEIVKNDREISFGVFFLERLQNWNSVRASLTAVAVRGREERIDWKVSLKSVEPFHFASKKRRVLF